MNTSIISHRMFVAALAHDGHTQEKPSSAWHDPGAQGTTGESAVKPSSKTLAALAARPWVNWPFVRVWEDPSAS